MFKNDALSQLKQLKKEIKASRNLQMGTVKGTGNKFGFVTLDIGKDVFLPPDEMQKVLPGDRIEVEVKKDDKKKTVAAIERLIESPTKVFFGKYITRGKAHFVEADIPGMARWFFVPPPKRKNAKSKDMVRCRVTQHPVRSGKAQASIEAVIGNELTPGIEWEYALAKHSIEKEWSEDILAEANQLDESIISEAIANREDLRALPFITIDSRSTTDMDDALWAEANDQGWLLRVAIADPCALIPPQSLIEKEALKRATSIYMPGMHIPMLPPKLAADLGSLVEGQDRLAKVVELNIDRSGALGDYRIFNAVIKSHRKLSYGDVASSLAKENRDLDEETTDLLMTLGSLAEALRSWRDQHALLHEGRTEFFLEIGDNRKIATIKEKILTPAHTLVEECMVAANRCVADLLSDKLHSAVFIQHQGLRPERKESVEALIREKLPSFPPEGLDHLDSYRDCVQALGRDDALRPILAVLTRQLEKSFISSGAGPHFGMGLPVYTTFTSPLRKGNDFVLHRLIDAYLSRDGKVEPISEKALKHIEDQWRVVRTAVNDVEQWLKCQFMANATGIYSARVMRCFATGFQVRLNESGIEGMVSTREMDGKYSFDQDRLRLVGKAATFELDQEISVRLKMVDWSRKQIQFEVVEPSSEAE